MTARAHNTQPYTIYTIHQVKFFERRKIERRLRAAKKKLRAVQQHQEPSTSSLAAVRLTPPSPAFRQIIADGGSDDSDDAAALKATIATLAADLQYVRFFPKAEHYVPLFPSGKQAEDETLPTR